MIFRKTTAANADGYYVIIGCGRLGASLASRLAETGGEVLVIDAKSSAFDKLPPTYGGMTRTGDAKDLDVLAGADLGEAAAVIIVTNNDNLNAMLAQLAISVFHAKRVIVRLYESERELVYRELGIDTICPSLLSAQEVDRLLGREVRR